MQTAETIQDQILYPKFLSYLSLSPFFIPPQPKKHLCDFCIPLVLLPAAPQPILQKHLGIPRLVMWKGTGVIQYKSTARR